MRGNSWRWQCGAFDAVPADVVGSHHLQITFSENQGCAVVLGTFC